MLKNILRVLVFFFAANITAQVENAPEVPNDRNWTSSISYNFNGQPTSKNVILFNTLGKSLQSQSWDVLTGRIWGQEVRYDSFDRPVLQTLSAPLNAGNFGYQHLFISTAPGITLIKSQYDSPSTQENPAPIYPQPGTLGWYYSSSNTLDSYQDITSYPYSRTLFSKLNPGSVKAVLGGNKVNVNGQQKWVQTYSFSMPAEKNPTGVPLFPSFGSSKIVKTVSRGVDGVEIVQYADSDGNTLAAARSGNEESSVTTKIVYSEITNKDYVDIHIPVGCGGSVSIVSPTGFTPLIKVFDLVTEQVVVSNISTLAPGFYRFEDVNKNYSKNFVPYQVLQGIKIMYSINYYDYSINEYDIADRLIASIQPLGSAGSIPLKQTFSYNSLNQLLSTTSPDEGVSKFKYRRDGQIRFSQNSEQAKNNSFSYTNYDYEGRPVESGVYTGSDVSFDAPGFGSAIILDDIVDDLNGIPVEGRSEVSSVHYDTEEPTLRTKLDTCGIPGAEYLQTFVSGNVSYTAAKKPSTSATWYSYDVYGRVKWIVQQINGLNCLKTIDYTYDPVNGNMVQVDYQRYSPSERFVHKYEYNEASQLVKVSTSLNNTTFTTQAKYYYNESGAMIRTELADNLQGIDYIYNLQGQLKAINHPDNSPAMDPGKDGLPGGTHSNFASDLFGMAIDYYNGDYSRTGTPTPVTTSPSGVNQLNGNIKATRWNTQTSSPTHNAYMYQYNKNNWLTTATFGTANATNNITGNSNGDYKVSGITYDANGNILTLNRKGYTDPGGSNQMDNFQYRYGATGLGHASNRLLSVKDTEDNPDSNRYSDLRDQDITVSTGGTQQSADNYIYNDLGQMTANMQDKVLYTYTASGLVSKIGTFSSDPASNFFKTLYYNNYDAFTTGNHGWANVGTAGPNDFTLGFPISTTTDCNTADLSSINTQFGNILQINGRITARKQFRVTPNTAFKLKFDLILDQFVNVLQAIPPTYVYDPVTDTFIEAPVGPLAISPIVTVNLRKPDGSIFYTTTTLSQPAELCGRYVTEQIAHNFVSGSEEYITLELVIANALDASDVHTNRKQKTFIDNLSLQAATIDKVVFFYNDRGQRVLKQSYHQADLTVSTYYVRDVAGSIMGIYSGETSPTIMSTPPLLSEHTIHGSSRIGIFKRTSGKFKGYELYEVTDHLGNVRAVLRKGELGTIALVTSKADYYPFGMPMPNKHTTANNYRYAFQGQEKDPETGMEAFELRLWEARLGRWLTIDPYHQYSSPYLGMGNNPIRIVDADGGYAEDAGDPPKGWFAKLFQSVSNLFSTPVTPDINGGTLDEVIINVPSQENSGTMAYVTVQGDITSHSFLLDPTSGYYWEASHPIINGKVVNGLITWISGYDKSIIRRRHINDADFWTFDSSGKKRGNLTVYLIKVPNKKETIRFANKAARPNLNGNRYGGSYDYNLESNNCKTFVMKALLAGHADVSISNPLPEIPTDGSGIFLGRSYPVLNPN